MRLSRCWHGVNLLPNLIDMRALLLLLLFTAAAPVVSAQCNYYYLQNNKTVTMAMYDRKGNPDGRYVYKVSGVSKEGNKTSASVTSEVFDKKGKSIGGGAGSMECQNGQLRMDMKMMMSPQQMQQFKNAKVEGKGAYMEYPSALSAGDQLQDASFTMDITMESGMAAQLSLEITNRQVEAKEKITTPAGTWAAFKIVYDAKTVINMGIAIPVKMQITEWFVPDFGVVKSSSKWGSQELTAIE